MRFRDAGYIGSGDGWYHALDHREDLCRYVSAVKQSQRLFNQSSGEIDTGGMATADIDLEVVGRT